MARSAMDRLGTALEFGQLKATLDYSNDLFALALLHLADQTGDAATQHFAEGIVGSFVTADGQIRDVPERGFRLDAMPAGLGPPPASWPPGTPTPRRPDTVAGGRDGSFAYYTEQPVTADHLHGLGPFILAGLEVARLPPPEAASPDGGCRVPAP